MNNKLSENLRRLRSQRGVAQKKLADLLHCSIGTISNYENGIHEPDCDTLSLLADFYGVSIDYLVGRSSRQYPGCVQNRSIYGRYTLDRFLHLMDILPEKHLPLLVSFLRLLEEIKFSGLDS